MQTPVDIAFRHCEPSEEIRSEIAAQVQRLEKFSPRITSCRVVVTGPQTGHRRGGFEVELRIAMPEHNEVVVDKSHADAPEREHALVAIREAFDAAVRQIENVMREFRGQVKHHAEASRGRVKNLLAGEDYGFIETADGRESGGSDPGCLAEKLLTNERDCRARGQKQRAVSIGRWSENNRGRVERSSRPRRRRRSPGVS